MTVPSTLELSVVFFTPCFMTDLCWKHKLPPVISDTIFNCYEDLVLIVLSLSVIAPIIVFKINKKHLILCLNNKQKTCHLSSNLSLLFLCWNVMFYKERNNRQ